MSRKLIAVAGLIISALALWWALRDIRFDQVGDALGHIQWGWFLLALPPWAFTFWAKVARWRLLYYPDEKRVSQGHLLAALLIGYLFNTILPLRTGELVRATVMRATQQLSIARTLSTILVEKVLDTITLVLGLGLILPFINLPANFRGPALLAAVGFGARFVLVLAGAIWPEPARRLLAWALRPVPPGLSVRITGIADAVLDGLIPLRQRVVAPRIAVWSLCAWVFNMVSVYCIMISFGLLLPPTAPALVVIAANLVMAVPSGPGYVGVYHETVKEATLVFISDPNTALAFAVVLHIFGFLPLAVAGAVALVREGLSFGNLRQAEAAPAVLPAPVDVVPAAPPEPVVSTPLRPG
jgi:uncharacterized membrane protein YbhN (UPF0104 family)